MSGLFSKISSSIPGGLILGEALAPLIAAAISVAVNARVSDTYTKAIIPLVFAEFFLLLALIACARLFNYNEPAQRPPPPVTCGTCQAEGGTTKEYVWRRVSEMSLNGFCGFFASAVWVYTMGSMPYMASGLCGANVNPTAEETQCAVTTPTFTVVASHVFCYIGRQIGTRFASMTERCYMMQTIFLECMLLAVFGFYSVHWCKTGGFRTEDMLPQAAHLAVGVTTIISGYANMLLIRLSYEAQKQCGHSVMFPCPVTTQITWVTRSFGSIGGVALSFYLNS
jgi:F0F1-type ATP synthase membrane subunit c/vacuolar-type H+-ATPase subunit K